MLAVGVLRKVAPQLDLRTRSVARAGGAPVGWCSSLYITGGTADDRSGRRRAQPSRGRDARPRRAAWKFLVWRTALALLAIGMLDPNGARAWRKWNPKAWTS